MELQSVLRELRDRGIFCRADGDRLICLPSGKLTDPLRNAIKAHKPELLKLVARWQALADSNADADSADNLRDELFLASCRIFRGAETNECLLARWNGMRSWLSKELPPAALLVLGRLVESLKAGEGMQ